ncbi:MAG: hypothetical protein K0U37_01845 [Gammaproteobacteria bacterium]|nr:hypothetical protein [Gammaproteobacteria bacterium]
MTDEKNIPAAGGPTQPKAKPKPDPAQDSMQTPGMSDTPTPRPQPKSASEEFEDGKDKKAHQDDEQKKDKKDKKDDKNEDDKESSADAMISIADDTKANMDKLKGKLKEAVMGPSAMPDTPTPSPGKNVAQSPEMDSFHQQQVANTPTPKPQPSTSDDPDATDGLKKS